MLDTAAPTMIGHVDNGSLQSLSGWAFDPAHPQQPVELEILHGSDLVCRVLADQFRADLQGYGYGDGRHAFTVSLPSASFTEPSVELRVRVRLTGQDLTGSPMALPNPRILLNSETLSQLAAAVAAAAASARSASDLHNAATWLLRQLDTVLARQSALDVSAQERQERFQRLVQQDTTLSDVLQQAAGAVLARYPALHLPDPAQPDVTVIIPVRDQFAHTYRCLDSILLNRPEASLEVIVVDDGSRDETVYAALLLSGGVKLLRNGANLGFVGSVNAGAAAARGRLLMLLNNDTLVQPGWLDELVGTFAADPTVGVAGSKLLYPDGTLQEAGGIIWRQGMGMNWGRGDDPGRPEYCFLRDADYVSGAALMIPRVLFEQVGGLSAAFAPAYYEDTDLCFKVRATGLRVVVQPMSRVTHHEGASAGTDLDGAGMKRFQRLNQRTFARTWSEALQHFPLDGADPRLAAERLVTRRALFIDDATPTPDQDAGSNAALEHMRSLQRLGYKVSFVGADSMAKAGPYTEALERVGIQCYYAPYYQSVEEIFRREVLQYDLFYIHRVANMTRYAAMIRQRFPGSSILFSVADLHHLRSRREAQVKQSMALEAQAAALEVAEMAALAAANTVVVHSSHEQKLAIAAGVRTPVHVLPWTVPLQPGSVPFSERSGLALIGGFRHSPNVDAAEWLVSDVLPHLHAAAPGIECLIVGSHAPDSVRALARPGVRLLGQVPDLSPVLARLRLTVAPLRFGAGLKGKVLTSLAAGVPCVLTRCAAEGMDLPAEYEAVIADTAEAFAARILLLHEDPALHERLRQAGLAYVAATCSAERVDALLAAACAKPQPMPAPMPEDAPAPPPITRRRTK